MNNYNGIIKSIEFYFFCFHLMTRDPFSDRVHDIKAFIMHFAVLRSSTSKDQEA